MRNPHRVHPSAMDAREIFYLRETCNSLRFCAYLIKTRCAEAAYKLHDLDQQQQVLREILMREDSSYYIPEEQPPLNTDSGSMI